MRTLPLLLLLALSGGPCWAQDDDDLSLDDLDKMSDVDEADDDDDDDDSAGKSAPSYDSKSKTYAKKVRRTLQSWLDDRRLDKIATLEDDPTWSKQQRERRRAGKEELSSDQKGRRYVLSESRVRLAYWKLLPKLYKSQVNRSDFWPAPERGGSLVLQRSKVLKVFVHRACVLVAYKTQPIELRTEFAADEGKRVRSLKRNQHLDVWVRESGKFVLARKKTKKGNSASPADRLPILGDQLIRHKWFTDDTVSMNEVAVRASETLGWGTGKGDANPFGKLSDKAKSSKLNAGLGDWLADHPVADLGLVEWVSESKKGQISLRLRVGLSLITLYIPLKESKRLREFYLGLKKRTAIVFRTKLTGRWKKSAWVGSEGSDGQRTVALYRKG